MSKPNLFTADQFTPTQFHTAEDKARFGNQLLRFIESDFSKAFFYKEVYNRLSNCFHHIAKYNQWSFYEVWFGDIHARVRFIENLLRVRVCGDPALTFYDVEIALKAAIHERGYLAKLRARASADVQTHELNELKRLQAKYPGARQ
jgi:hypothetical protein